MQDKDSFLIEQAYTEMLNKRVVKEASRYKHTRDVDHSYDFQDYMQECMRAAFDDLNQDMQLREEMMKLAKKIGVDVSPDATVEELYYALPPDCAPCVKVTAELEQAEKESAACYRDESDYRSTLASHRRE